MAGKEIMAIADKVTKHSKFLAYPRGKFQTVWKNYLGGKRDVDLLRQFNNIDLFRKNKVVAFLYIIYSHIYNIYRSFLIYIIHP